VQGVCVRSPIGDFIVLPVVFKLLDYLQRAPGADAKKEVHCALGLTASLLDRRAASSSTSAPMRIVPLAPAVLATLCVSSCPAPPPPRHSTRRPRSASITRSSRRAPSRTSPETPDVSASSSCSEAACPRRGRTSSPHVRCSPSASATSPPRPTSTASQRTSYPPTPMSLSPPELILAV
jgi:hypothetical protein